MVEFTSVQSSNLSGVHYDPDTQVLTVEFKNGGQYSYADVPQDEYDSLMGAGSKGSYFNNYIKDSYTARRV